MDISRREAAMKEETCEHFITMGWGPGDKCARPLSKYSAQSDS